MPSFSEALKIQRWDDHRYYHQSRINQSLHLFSAVSFLCAYVLLFKNPVAASLTGWFAAMVTRQIGHFVFEPKDYDEVNHETHEHKEELKVGYNLYRKVWLMGIWALSPLVLYFDPTLLGFLDAPSTIGGFVRNVALMWLAIAAGGLVFRTVQLFIIKDVQTGLVWLTKVLTDPFHDIKIYHMAPIYLLSGQLLDPMTHDLSGQLLDPVTNDAHLWE